MAASTIISLLTICLSSKIILTEGRVVTTHSTQQLVDAWIAQKPGGVIAVAVVSPEETEYFFGGKTDGNKNALPDEHTLFEIGSITKTFTGLLLADEVLSGNVFLNDTLIKLLTDWPGRFSSSAGNVTLLELATHSSGLPRLPANLLPAPLPENPYANYTVDKLYDWLDVVELSNIGTFLYSNAGVGILGHALSVRAGLKYEDFIKQRILNPLGLRDTTITLNSDQKSRIAPGHNAAGQIVANWDLDVLAPAGALRASVSEFAHFLRFATGLSQQNRKLYKALNFATQPRGITSIGGTIGLCWLQMLFPGDKLLIWHNGATGGYHAYIGWLPERQVGVAALASMETNGINPVDNLALDIFTLITK